MSHIHVCLVSEQPIPNLTTIFQFKPDLIILLETKEMKEKTRLLKDVIEHKGIKVKIETIEAYNIKNVIDVSELILKSYKDCDITLNITGGTKIGTLGTFQAFYTAGKKIIYVDTKNNRILKLFPEEQQQEVEITVKISINDYLKAYGFMVESYVKDDNYIFKRKNLTKFLAQNIDLVKQLNNNLHTSNERSNLPVTISFSANRKFESLINELGNVRFDDKKLIINDYASLRYLKGIWLEEYVYMQTKALNPDEIKLNVTGRWITSSKHKPRNEFDVLFSKGNRLFYISCKTSNPNRIPDAEKSTNEVEGVGRDYLYELDSIGDTAFGLFGQRMIASARKIEDPYIKERARILRIEMIDGRNIITLKEKVKQWLQS